jgi:hypothetical protein
MQKRIWDLMKPGEGPEKLEKTIEKLKKEDGRFTMEGGSWTNNISWVRGYESMIGPMEQVSSLFYRKTHGSGVSTSEYRYRNALYYLLTSRPAATDTGGAGSGWTTARSFAAGRNIFWNMISGNHDPALKSSDGSVQTPAGEK